MVCAPLPADDASGGIGRAQREAHGTVRGEFPTTRHRHPSRRTARDVDRCAHTRPSPSCSGAARTPTVLNYTGVQIRSAVRSPRLVAFDGIGHAPMLISGDQIQVVGTFFCRLVGHKNSYGKAT